MFWQLSQQAPGPEPFTFDHKLTAEEGDEKKREHM